jgi:hypothetical protein
MEKPKMSDQLLREISQDRALAAHIIFSHRHKQATPPFHIEMTDLWRSADEFVEIEAFRQGAKTTVSEEFLLIEALFKNFNYLLIFGETYTKACARITTMKYELATNLKIYNLFGKQKLVKEAENKLIMPNGVCIEAHGWEEEIRGYLHLDFRPDRAYLDDIENKERTKDSATVDINWKKLYMQLIPAMDKENRKVRMTGTPLADDCMITRAAASPMWTSAKFPICDRDIDDPAAKSLWPERYPMEWIISERDRYEKEGMLREFNQEFMLLPTGAIGKPFTEDMLAFEDVAPRAFCPRVLIMDPARTTEIKKSDQTGHVVVSKLGSRIFIHASDANYWMPDQVVQGAFDISAEFDDAEVAIEKNSLEEWLLQPLRAKMLTVGRVLKLKVMNAPQDRNKDQFIMGLRPFLVAKDIVFVGGRSKHSKLIGQILNFPSGKKDVINALAYALRVFSGITVYGDFSDRHIGQTQELSRGAMLMLGVNCTGTETAAVLVAVDGPFITVLGDWISPLMPNEAVPDIARAIRVGWPGKNITVWTPSDVFEQAGHNPLLGSLKAAGWKPNCGEHTTLCRANLTPLLRQEVRRRALFCVDQTARNTLQAMAYGYNFPVKTNGERASEPERNAARTLIEALEVLTFAIDKQENAPGLTPNATNVGGTAYFSALPSRK